MSLKSPHASQTDNRNPSQVIEEHAVEPSGETVVRRYMKGRVLSTAGSTRYYEFLSLDTKKITAAKIVAKASLTKSRQRQRLMSEIEIHRSLEQGNIVRFEHSFEDAENVYILLELCANQTMLELIRRRKRLTETEVQSYGFQVISALQYLRAHRVIHRDLKLGNLFLSERMEVKLGGFGLATRLSFEGERRRTICGTQNCIAPEVLAGKNGYSYEVDIWYLGVVLYTLLVGRPPFEAADVKTTYSRIKTNACDFPDTSLISDSAKALISLTLTNDPGRRPSLDTILEHEFFRQGNGVPRLISTREDDESGNRETGT